MTSQKVLDQLRKKRNEILQTTEKYGASNIRVFGSTVRNEAKPSSDIDLLIHIDQDSGTSLFDLARLQEELEQLMDRRVDLVLDDTLHPAISDRIVKEAQPL